MSTPTTIMQPKTCTVTRVLVDATVEITPPSYAYRYWRTTPEERQADLERWVKEFQAFLRDHRSQDANILSVVPVYEKRCSACDKEYEAFMYADTPDGVATAEHPAIHEGCASCGALKEKGGG